MFLVSCIFTFCVNERNVFLEQPLRLQCASGRSVVVCAMPRESDHKYFAVRGVDRAAVEHIDRRIRFVEEYGKKVEGLLSSALTKAYMFCAAKEGMTRPIPLLWKVAWRGFSKDF